MNKSDPSVLMGLGVGFGALLVGFLLEGGSPLSLVGISALIIITGGTMGALIISFNLPTVLNIGKYFSESLKAPNGPNGEIVLEIVTLSEKARREGLLVLEEDVERMGDEFQQKGIKMMVDGVDPEVIKNTLEKDIELFEDKKKMEHSVFEAAGGFSPTMGIIGTVMGLVLVLANLGGNVQELGHSIATAFIATLYGICFANMIWIPVGLKLKHKTQEEILRMEMVMVGILSIQAGENPSLLKERLISYLEKEDLQKLQVKESE